MHLSGVIDQQVPSCTPQQNLQEATERMWKWGVDTLPVCDETRRYMGCVTTRAICRMACATGRGLGELLVAEATTGQVLAGRLEQDPKEALDLMIRERLWQLPVIDVAGCLVGIVRYERLQIEMQRELEHRGEHILVLRNHGQPDTGHSGPGGGHGWTFLPSVRELVSPTLERAVLSRSECRLLLVLVEHHGNAISRDDLMRQVCNRHYYPGDRYIDVLIGSLRRKFGERANNARIIRTVHGHGYLLGVGVVDERHWGDSTGGSMERTRIHPASESFANA